MMPDLDGLEKFFLRAMADGWPSIAANKLAVPQLPGSKVIDYHENELHLIDLYFGTSLSDNSAGMTVIFWHEMPVWSMSYGGWYRKSTVPFLKYCLLQAYAERQKFCGGRGPEIVGWVEEYPGFLYMNRCHGNFIDFHGTEWIHRQGADRPFGTHWYRGGMMVETTG